MRYIADATEEEMIALFLQTEITSTRWGPVLTSLLRRDHTPRAIIDHPDVTNSQDNAYRLQLLAEFRGYRRNRGLFAGFPRHVVWKRVGLTRDELWEVKYINYDYWTALTEGSRLAVDAARTINSGTIAFDVPNDGFHALVRALRGGAVFPDLIIARAEEGADLVLLEGHVRLTAYALAPNLVPPELPVMLGTAPGMRRWSLY